MRLDACWNVRTEAQVVLCAAITASKVDQVHGPDHVTMTAMIEEPHQNGTLSVSTMYRRFRIPRGMRLMRNPPRFLAFASALFLLL
jgi:hypothetical protein